MGAKLTLEDITWWKTTLGVPRLTREKSKAHIGGHHMVGTSTQAYSCTGIGAIWRGQGAIWPRRVAIWPRWGAIWPWQGAIWPRRGAIWPRRGAKTVGSGSWGALSTSRDSPAARQAKGVGFRVILYLLRKKWSSVDSHMRTRSPRRIDLLGP